MKVQPGLLRKATGIASADVSCAHHGLYMQIVKVLSDPTLALAYV